MSYYAEKIAVVTGVATGFGLAITERLLSLGAAVMLLSVALLPLLMWVLGIAVMNFYQFCILITAYGAFVGRIFNKLLTVRCLQGDYVAWVRENDMRRSGASTDTSAVS